MLLEEDKPEHSFVIKRYNWPNVEFSNKTRSLPICFSAVREYEFELPERFEDMSNTNWQDLLQLDVEILLCGTGNRHQFLPHELENVSNSMTIDCMNNAAACRTFTLLTSEFRSVAIVLFKE